MEELAAKEMKKSDEEAQTIKEQGKVFLKGNATIRRLIVLEFQITPQQT
ncbi:MULTISPECIES: hypothetical protein [Neisseriaceae]|jgi:hypothetical protein|nr:MULTISPECIES: hypothetical protein [Neisseriaceae]MBS6045706.1 hypothetical protein [Neisseria sp.]MDU4438326.1 hypothetical protein [Neisseria sp.]